MLKNEAACPNRAGRFPSRTLIAVPAAVAAAIVALANFARFKVQADASGFQLKPEMQAVDVKAIEARL